MLVYYNTYLCLGINGVIVKVKASRVVIFGLFFIFLFFKIHNFSNNSLHLGNP